MITRYQLNGGYDMNKMNDRKFDNFKLYYWHGASLVGKYQLPQLKTNKLIPPIHSIVSFSEISKVTKPSDYCVDFFLDDYRYECFWNAPEKYLPRLRQFQMLISTDYSMFPEMLFGQRLWNCTRNRVMSYYLQENGIKVIPVASWCDPEDFDWCFDGLPKNSSIAVSSNGCLLHPYGKNVFINGIEELQRQKSPFKIIVCGRRMKELNIFDNIIYYPNHYQRYEVLNNGKQGQFNWKFKSADRVAYRQLCLWDSCASS